ncbi:MAG: site-specific integrase, partial [Planctomycetes bacterium]|nr:site-specific integrase [Planctomycetota bacterium]
MELRGRRVYLGAYNSPESRARFHQVLAEFEANGGELTVSPDEITIMEVAARFWTHVEAYYRKSDGTATSEQAN